MTSLPKLHVRNIFELFIPISGFAQISVALSTTPSFGVTITQPNVPNFNYHYQIQIYERDDDEEDFVLVQSDHEVFAWGKRNPYTVKRNPINNELEGIILKIKINHSVFTFRRIKRRTVRFQVNCFNSAQFIQRGLSQTCELNPKKRGVEEGDGDDGVRIPVMWLNTDSLHSSPSIYDSPSYQSSDHQLISNDSQDRLDSSFEEKFHPESNPNIHIMDSSDMDTSADDASFGDQQIVPIQYRQGNGYDQQLASPAEEQYMVLYNGNAEVIGNFRALNFYKASDINLKEDIRLLQEDYDCRESLLKIDGVEYKFKDHVNHATNKRFVGYIAQQIGSVIPNAVQLIDGILHVDYESLIPYLSEAMKQNYQDIKDLKSETERITKIMDLMYTEFTQKEQRRKDKKKRREPSDETSSVRPTTREEFDVESGDPKKSQLSTGSGIFSRKKWLIAILVAVAVVISVAITVAVVRFARPKQEGNIDIVPPGDDPLIREALREFFRATKGSSWKFSTGWVQSNLTYCKWRAIKCNDQSEIIGIYLTNNNLQGFIPQSIQSIKTLESLMLSDNSISGKVPSTIAALENLTELDLSRNYFDPWSIPEEFAQLTKLKKLFLDSTRLIGSVPQWLNTLKELRILHMADNKLHGTLSKFSNTLRELDLTSNQLSGSIPRFWGNTTQLNMLKLGSNRFIGQLTNLQSVAWVDLLDLSNNQLEGEIATAGNGVLDSVTALSLENNLFESLTYRAGSVPRKLTYCKAGGNRFRCPIANWLKNSCGASCT